MHRRTLTLRRFGEMSFGLGYFEDGIWVDHSVPEGTMLGALTGGNAAPSDRAIDAVHQWYACCAGSTEGEHEVGVPADSAISDIPPRLLSPARSASSR